MNDRASNALVQVSIPSLAMNEEELVRVLQGSVYPGAKIESIKLVIGYCKSQNLDPILKPVHIVPMDVPTGRKDSDGWDITEKRDVVMPGIGLYRIQASRTEEHVGTSEPTFGPDITAKLGETEITYPAWCMVTVKRMRNGAIAEYPAVERWLENYASKSRSKKDPNKMWAKRPYAQLAKCAEAQALRKGFPEVGSAPTAEEMEGKILDEGHLIDGNTGTVVAQPSVKPAAPPVHTTNTKEPIPGEARREPDPPAGEQQPAEDLTKPITEGQLRILRAKMKAFALTDTDLEAAFGPIGNLKFAQFADLQTWIAERAPKT